MNAHKVDKIMLCAVLSRIQLFVTPWTLACQAPLSMRILQAKILEWVAMPSYRGSSQPRIEPRSLHCRWILYHLSHQGSLLDIFKQRKLLLTVYLFSEVL